MRLLHHTSAVHCRAPHGRAVKRHITLATSSQDGPAVSASPEQAAASSYPLESKFRESYTMSQVYVKDRPAPIPLSDFEKRRKKRDLEEICQAGKRRGVSAELLTTNMNQVDVLVPGLVNLHKAKAADWVLILSDINMFMSKLILMRELFPNANLHKILSAQPKLLLKPAEQLQADGKRVRSMLSAAPDPDAIVEAVPDLINPVTLSRSLVQLQALFKGCDPVDLLVKNPTILLEMGEARVEAMRGTPSSPHPARVAVALWWLRLQTMTSWLTGNGGPEGSGEGEGAVGAVPAVTDYDEEAGGDSQ